MTPTMKVRDCPSILLRTIMSLESAKVLGGGKAGMVHQDLKAQEVIQGYLVDPANVAILEIEGHWEIRVCLRITRS
jgi:hypothetical protein